MSSHRKRRTALNKKTRQSRARRGWPDEAIDEPANACKQGERNPAAKLTARAVAELRARADNGAPIRELAQDFAVSPRQVRRIVRREHWRNDDETTP